MGYLLARDLQQHISTEHESKDIKCRHCGKNFIANWQLFETHLKQLHKLECEKCEKKFTTREEKEKHSLDIHGVVKGLDLRCGKCEEEFPDTAKFREHFKVPHSHPCAQCDNKYPCTEALAAHVDKQHNKINKLICKLCKKRFGSVELHKQHEEVAHTYACELCDAVFIKGSKLKEHIEERHQKSKHFDEKYTCKLCNTVFF